MAYEIGIESRTIITAADLSALQYRFVFENTSGLAAQVVTQGVKATGVVQNKPTSGQAATVAYDGITKLVAGAAVAAGAEVMSDNVGRGITATTGNRVLALAETAAGAAGEIISVRLTDPYLI